MNVPARIQSVSAPRDYSPAQLQLIRNTVARDTTPDEFDMFIEICRRQQLDPFRKQIHALVFSKDDAKKRQVAFITGIDGYRAIAKRAGNYRPDENEPDITYLEEKKNPDTNPLGIVKAAVTVWQYAVDGWHPIRGVAHWEEFAPFKEDGGQWEETGEFYPDSGKPKKRRVAGTGKKVLAKDNWKTMPQVMIAKCAEAQALRRGWPEDMGGLYVQEELDRHLADVSASEAADQYMADERMKRIGASEAYPMIFAFTEGLTMIPHGQMADKIMEHARSLETSTDVEMWRDMNRVGLQQYWAKNPSEALEVKRQLEDLINTKLKKEKENV